MKEVAFVTVIKGNVSNEKNMKFSIEAKVLEEAVMRCATIKDGYSISFFPNKKNENVWYATFSACDTMAMSYITVVVTPKEEVTSKKVLLGTEFASAVKAICQVGKEILFDLKESSCELSCEEAKVLLNYKTQVVSFAMKSPKTEEHAAFVIDTKNIKRLVQQGGFAFGMITETDPRAGLNNILLLPCVCNKTSDNGMETVLGLRAVTSNGFYATSSYAIVKQGDTKFTEMVQSGKGICLPPQTISLISNLLKSETVTIYIFDTQLLIKDGNDIFVLILASLAYPMQLLQVFDEPKYSFRFNITVNDLKVALNIVSVNSANPNTAAMVLDVGECGVTIFSKETGNKATLKAEQIEGKAKITLCIKQIKEIITKGTTEVTSIVISGNGETSPLHIKGGSCSAFTLPIIQHSEVEE